VGGRAQEPDPASSAGTFRPSVRERPQSPFDPPPGPSPGGRNAPWALVALVAGLFAIGGTVVLLTSGGEAGSRATGRSTDGDGGIPRGGGSGSGASDGSGHRTVVSSESTIEAGRYIQAGSFRTSAGGETERRRLAGDGVDVSVFESDEAQELYPGFQVLLAGPVYSSGNERSLLRELHENGVPSAFSRDLSPARTLQSPAAVLGEWVGTVERTGSSQPGLNGTLPVTLRAVEGGVIAELEFSDPRCEAELTIDGRTSFSFSYGQSRNCVGGGSWRLRPNGDELAAVLFPPDTDTIVLGTLQRPESMPSQ
jgi:hypothetical protein